MSRCTYMIGDVRRVLDTLPDDSVDLVLTSPPFLAVRSYLPPDHPDKADEIGLEPDPETYLDTLLDVTARLRRVLAPHGTLAVELGDTYSGSGGGGGDYLEGGWREGQQQFAGSAAAMRESNAAHWRLKNRNKDAWPLPKSLSLCPESYRWALAYGRNPFTGEESPAGRWRVRNNVDWARPSPPVGALADKFRPSTSDLVIACTAADRWFDAVEVRTPGGGPLLDHWDIVEALVSRGLADGLAPAHLARFVRDRLEELYGPDDAWVLSAGGYKGSHYAVFPPELLWRPIEACCPRRVCRTCGAPSRRLIEQVDEEDVTVGWTSCGCPGTDGLAMDGSHSGPGWRPGVVLDPFIGSGTTGIVATGRGRDCIGIDLDDRNIDLARERLGLFLDVEYPLAEAAG